MRCQCSILASGVLLLTALPAISALPSTPSTVVEPSPSSSSSTTTTLHQTHPPRSFHPNTNNNNNNLPPTPGSSCIRAFSHTPIFQISTFIWTVTIPGQMLPSKQGSGEWGGGLLDTLRLYCGAITTWYAQLNAVKPPHTGIQVMFYSQTCSLQDVQNAAFEASKPDDRVVLRCEFPHGGGGAAEEQVVPVDEVEIGVGAGAGSKNTE